MNKKDIIDGFRAVVQEMGYVQEEKINEYGIARYQDLSHESEAAVMLNSDLYRKFIRLRQQLLYGVLSGVAPDWYSVRNGCVDLANYAVMGVQIADLIMSRGKQPPGWARPSTPPSDCLPIEQIALVGRADLINLLTLLGATEWHHDDVTTRARVFGGKVVTQEAHLAFNYQLIPGKELEVIQYMAGTNWLSESSIMNGLSHMGLHVTDINKATDKLQQYMGEMEIAQDAVTLKHTNPVIKDTRRYRYRIFATRKMLGFDLKFIERRIITPGDVGIHWGSEGWMDVTL